VVERKLSRQINIGGVSILLQLGLVKPRGLVNEKDTFEIFVSRDFRERYDDTFTMRLAHDLRHRSERKRDSGASRSDDAAHSKLGSEAGLNLPDPKTIAASNRLNDYLTEFIEKRGRVSWQEGTRNYCERFLDFAPSLAENGPALFYSDDEFEFKQCLVMGIDRDWIILTTLFYAVLDIMFSNTFVSILVTYVGNRLVLSIRAYFAEINIGAKTLVDEKFLVK